MTTGTPLAPDIASAPPDRRVRCPAVKRNGSICGAVALPSGSCIGHRQGADDARRLGGRNSARAIRAERRLPPPLKKIGILLHIALEEVYVGTLAADKAKAMASLASVLIKVHEADALEERLIALEERIEGGSQ